MEILLYGVVGLLSYIVGSFPTAYLVVKQFAHKNVMEFGSGNVGAMNTHRITKSKKLLLLVFLVDAGKGLVAFLLAQYCINRFSLLHPIVLLSMAGALVVIGHNHSLFLKCKGGKGLATGAGFFILLSPWIVVIFALICLAAIALTRYFVLGQILGTMLTPLVVWFALPDYKYIVLCVSIPIFLKHAPRIRNLLNGTEPKMYYKLPSSAKNK